MQHRVIFRPGLGLWPVFFIAFFFIVAGGGAPCRAGTVLTLFSEGRESPRAASLLRGLRLSLPDEQVRAAYLDMDAHASEEDAYEAFLRLRQSLDTETLSGIVAVGPQAAAFVRMFADQSPLDAPKVSVEAGPDAQAGNATRSSAVEKLLLDTVRDQHPEARTYVVFTSPDEAGALSRARLEKLVAGIPDGPLLVFPGFEVGRAGLLERRAMLDIVRGAPDDSVVVLMGLPVEEPVEGIVSELTTAATVPVYAGGDMPPVRGMEGAVVTDWFAHGRAAGSCISGRQQAAVVEVSPRVQYELHDARQAERPGAPDSGSGDPLRPGVSLLVILGALALLTAVISFLLLRKR